MTLSQQLTTEFGNGFSRFNLSRMIQFAEAFPEEQIVATLSQHSFSIITGYGGSIDLKLEKFTPSDVGQMEFYMRWLKKHEMRPGENEPLGLILCAEKSDERIELTLPSEVILPKEHLDRRLRRP